MCFDSMLCVCRAAESDCHLLGVLSSGVFLLPPPQPAPRQRLLPLNAAPSRRLHYQLFSSATLGAPEGGGASPTLCYHSGLATERALFYVRLGVFGAGVIVKGLALNQSRHQLPGIPEISPCKGGRVRGFVMVLSSLMGKYGDTDDDHGGGRIYARFIYKICVLARMTWGAVWHGNLNSYTSCVVADWDSRRQSIKRVDLTCQYPGSHRAICLPTKHLSASEFWGLCNN